MTQLPRIVGRSDHLSLSIRRSDSSGGVLSRWQAGEFESRFVVVIVGTANKHVSKQASKQAIR